MDYEFWTTLEVFDDGEMLGDVCPDLQRRSSGKPYCMLPNLWSERPSFRELLKPSLNLCMCLILIDVQKYLQKSNQGEECMKFLLLAGIFF